MVGTDNPNLRLKCAKRDFFGGKRHESEMELQKILAAHPGFICAVSFYIKLLFDDNRVGEARVLFDKNAIYDTGSALHHAMIKGYGEKGQIENAREMFDMAVGKGVANRLTYMVMSKIYYDNRMFEQIEKIFEGAPEKILEDESVLNLAESLRKTKKYGEALEIVGLFMRKCGSNGFLNERYAQARVIRANTLLDSGRINEAHDDFFRMKVMVPRTSYHYPRVLCGCVFSDCRLPPEERMTEAQKEEFRSLLSAYLELHRSRGPKPKISENLLAEIDRALYLLEPAPAP